MGKYDFGLVIEKGSTHEWAFDHVEENSNVLELGAANGLLTNALHNGKNCIVDIVELDEEAGMQASTYSRNAILGARGDLNGDKWCESLSQNEYDYVVILDVLEHLDNPLKVLEKVKSLLKQEGKLLLSIPNIAHNSVVISLLKGKFEYTKLGLLDSTHRYFVTYESAQELVRNAGFSLEKVNAIKKTVGDNEITVQYSDVDPEIRYYLRNRLNGEIYQTLIVAGKYETEVEYLTDGESDKNTRRDYQAVILPDGKSDKRIDIETHHGIIDYVVSAEIIEKCNSLRFIPMENDCIVCDLVVSIVDNSGITTMLQPNWFTGKKNEGVYIFIEEQHEVNYLIPQGYSGYVHISAKCYPIFGDIGNCLKEYIYGKCLEKAETDDLVSVIMPCYNDGAYILEAIESIRNQTYDKWELIIIDDGSDDEQTCLVLKDIDDVRIKVVHTDHLKPAGARNYGIEIANGQYILPVDSDDTISPTYMEKAISILKSNSNIAAVYCKADLFGEKTGEWDLPEYSFENMLLDNVVFVSAMFEKKTWKKVGGFNTNMTCGMEDYDFWLSILELGKEIYQIPEVLFHYRIKSVSRTTGFQSDYKVVQGTYRQIYENHKDFYHKNIDLFANVLRDALIEQISIRTKYEKIYDKVLKYYEIPLIGKIMRRIVKI